MRRRLKQAGLVLLALLAVSQLIRPDRTNPTTTASHTIQAHMGNTSALVPVLSRSCNNCHSYATEWAWYTQIAPLSWTMAYAVNHGRKSVNFSQWTTYSPDQQRSLLELSCADARSGKMPGVYTAFNHAARLSTRDVEAICAASRQTEATALPDSQSTRSIR